MNKKIIRLILIAAVILLGILILRYYGLDDYLTLENLRDLRENINQYGYLAPIVYILFYITATVFFLPGLPLTIIGGIIFGPIWGSVWASTGAILGSSLSFLAGRYAVRDLIIENFSQNKYFQKIEIGVKEHGWRIVLLTRLIPLFPFNAQNYIYGLTNINFITYFIFSWLGILPATIVYCFAAGAVVAGGSLRNTIFYLSTAGLGLIILSLLPRWIKKNNDLIDED
jgi:uncharacterized membrane protein YdjX (TVP38/TMEM64 family)